MHDTMSGGFVAKSESQKDGRVMRRWGVLAALALAVAYVAPTFVYLTGNLRDALGPQSYALADFLAGPVWAASLIVMVLSLRAEIGWRAERRMSYAANAAWVAAAAMLCVACLRAANRHYHLSHPDLHLESATQILVVWTTLVAGVAAAGWHALGWSMLLIASAGWHAGSPPRGLSILYFLGGAAALFVYMIPELEGVAMSFGLFACLWQAAWFWQIGLKEKLAPSMESR